jgi:DNA-binding MarR family transcriptional regulator
MPIPAPTPILADLCNCFAVRKAARHVTQLYDQCLAAAGLRITQFGILARLRARGPLSINALAAMMAMDRTTLGRNILPLEREALIEIVPSESDRRSKELRLTPAGTARLKAAEDGWHAAQARFEATLGKDHAAHLRAELHNVAAQDF